MALEKINLGEYPTGKGGDNQRIASEKFNKAVDALGQEATTTQKGVVQLNNTLTSSSDKHALTAAMGKKLDDEKLSLSGGEVDGALSVVGTITAKQRINVGRLDTINQERTFAIYSSGMGVKFAIRSRVSGALDFTDAASYSFDKAVKADLDGNAKTATKLETPRKINGVDFDGSKDIETPVFGATNGLVPARIGSTSNRFLNENGTWSTTPNTNTTYSFMSESTMQAGTSTIGQVVSAERIKQAVEFWGTSVVRTYKDLVVQGGVDYKNSYPHDIQITVSLSFLQLNATALLLINGKNAMMLKAQGEHLNLQAWIPSGATWRVSLINGARISPNYSKEYS